MRQRSSTRVYSGDAAQDHDLRISHIAIDRAHTTAEDPGSYFPLPALRDAAARGLIGSVAPRFHGLPTNRSHRTTLEMDCPELVARCQADAVDAALLVPNCPVCHQSVSLAARALEETASPPWSWAAPRTLSSMSACRACCSPTSRSAMRRAGRAIRLRRHDPRPRAARSWKQAPAARTTVHHHSLERRSRLEARLLQYRTPVTATRSGARRAEFDKAKDVAKAVREATG